jgi:hypothetical protein
MANTRQMKLATLAAGLTVLCLIVLVDGFASFLWHGLIFKDTVRDLHRRWVEEACVRAGIEPFAAMNGGPAPAAGRPMELGYPPWELTVALAFTLPGWTATRWLFAAWNVAAIGVIARWAYRIGRRADPCGGSVLALAILAIGVNRTILDVGQYALVICAFLVLSLQLEEAGFESLAGAALGLSLIKFSLSLPFCLCFLVKGKWKTLAVAAGVVIAAALASWPMIHVPPWTDFARAMGAAESFSTNSPTPLKALVKLGFSTRAAIRITAVGLFSAAGLLMWHYRQRSLVTLFALAALAARFWTYHLWYDDAILMFLLAALGGRAFAARRGEAWRDWLVFLAVGLSLWLTIGFLFRWPVVVTQNIIWFAGLVWLLHDDFEQPAAP